MTPDQADSVHHSWNVIHQIWEFNFIDVIDGPLEGFQMGVDILSLSQSYLVKVAQKNEWTLVDNLEHTVER